MFSPSDFLVGFLDTLTGHLALAVYLLAVTDERAVWRRLKKLPLLLLSPLIAVLLSAGLHTVPILGTSQYFISSFAVLIMCTLWVRWAWQFGFLRAFAATCMAGIFQVAESTMSFWMSGESIFFMAQLSLYLGASIVVSLLLYKLRFGRWFRLLLDSETVPWRMALLLFALEASMEVFLSLGKGVHPQYLPFYYLMASVLVLLTAALMIYLAQRFETARKMHSSES